MGWWEWWSQALIILGMFLVRLVVPMAIVLGVGYWLRRLDNRWQAEAVAEWETRRTQPEPLQSKFLERLNQPCWQIKGCDPAVRATCPAAQQPKLECWLARRGHEGRLPESCYQCHIFLYGKLGHKSTGEQPLTPVYEPPSIHKIRLN
jgi:hypothetical protein